MSVIKRKPMARVEYSYGNDGRDGEYYVQYSCPKCGKKIRFEDIACDECGTFFDWSQKARIKVVREVEWVGIPEERR